jgi:hypothetical protein
MATFWRTSIMMEKLAQPGEGGGCTPIPFLYIYHHVKNCGVRSIGEGRCTLPISTLRLYVLCGTNGTKESYTARHTMYLYKLKLYKLKGGE